MEVAVNGRQYRKRPVVVEAVQWDGTIGCANFLCEWADDTYIDDDGWLQVVTLEGVMTATIGDWIIKGVQGEFYPCANSIFEQTYERA